MVEAPLIQVASVPIMGIASVWLAWRLKLPSILVLLIVGLLIGPVLGLFHPDAIFGNLLFPFVSLFVAIIMFEGGLSLNIQDIRDHGRVIRNLVTVGNLVTWIVVSLGAHFFVGTSWSISVLLGSILVVTGPTVIIPLLAHIRPNKSLSSILRWEGILIDPVGAIQAIFVLEVVLLSAYSKVLGIGLVTLLKTVVFGGVFGTLAAGLLILVILKRWTPDFLQELLTLMFLFAAYSFSDFFQAESGLFAVTIMGIVMANQKLVTVKHIVTFKENLTLLLLSALFIVLAARLPLDALLSNLNWGVLGFLLVVILLARPLSIFASTRNSKLSFKEKLFLSWMAPRGIVAAAVASLFSIQLESAGIPGGTQLVTLTFMVIICTVVLYGLTSQPIGRLLGVLEEKNDGVLFVGASEWVRDVASILKIMMIPSVLVDTNKANVMAAKRIGLIAHQGSVLSDQIEEDPQVLSLGNLLATTTSDEVNLLATVEYAERYGSQNVLRMTPEKEEHSEKSRQSLYLFDEGITCQTIASKYAAGSRFKQYHLHKDYTFEQFQEEHPDALLLMAVTEKKQVKLFSNERKPSPQPTDTVVYLE